MSDGPLSPEEVAHRGFGTTFRGFDTGEVRAYLQRVANDLRDATARERDLHRRLADAEHRAAHPVLEGDALTRALGDEMGRVLATAQEAANGLRDKAEENAARILREAHDQAQRIRAQAEAILAVRTEEADAEAAEMRRAAQQEGAGVVERARREAADAMADVEGKARQLVHDAQAARARVLGDLTRRRRLLQTQVEQLRAGRERLLEAYRKVRSTTDEVADELQRVENEAREAAGAAGERVAALADADDRDDVMAAFPADTAVAGAGGGDAPPAPPAPPDGGEVPGRDAGGTAPSAGGLPPGEAGATPESAAGGVPAQVAGSAGASSAPPVAPIAADVKLEVAAQLAGQAAEAAEADALSAEAAAVEAAGEDGGPGTGEATRVVSTRPGGSSERRPLRLLRRPKPGGRPLDVVPGQPDDEAVRVIAADPEAPTPDPEAPSVEAEGTPPGGTPLPGPAPEDRAGPDTASSPPAPEGDAPDPSAGGADLAAASVAGVDELFARIRAGRADAVARAHEVLAGEPGAPVHAADPPPGDQREAEPVPQGPPAPLEEESLLRRRDTAVEGIEAKLARKLKRALQDEQNEVLDRLRSARTGADDEAVLLAATEQADRYRRAADELLPAAAAAGVAFVVPGEDARPDVPDIADVVNELAAALAEPLRRALQRALGGDGADQAVVGERIGAAYRECKAQRIEGLAGDAVTAAFGRGTLAALPPEAASRWVVDDDGRPCPDCDDNALAGPTPAGEAFPTGQLHPPAHAGCRCLLAPADRRAALAGPA